MRKGDRLFKKTTVIMLLIVFAICFAVPMAVNAATTVHHIDMHLYQEGDFTELVEDANDDGVHSNASYGAATLSLNQPVVKTYDDLNDHEKAMYDVLNNVTDYIGFNVFDSITFEWGKKMLTGVINDFPQFFYVSSSFDYQTTKWFGNSYVTGIWPMYSMSKDEIASARTTFDNGVNKAMACVNNTMDDAQKALVIHDYLLSNSYYCEDGYYTHSAYGMFKNRRTVCAGYTLAYSYIMNKLGIPCQYMYSESMAHAWNCIEIDGLWYQCDLTWDDTTASYGVNQDAYGIVAHQYFLKSKDYMTNNGHNEFLVRIDDLSTDNTRFDNAFWNDISTPIPVDNGTYYYPDPVMTSSSQAKVTIKSVDKNFNETVLLNTAQYCEAGGNYVACNLAILDGKLYMANSPSSYKGIYCIKNKMTYKVANLDAAPVGLYVEDNQLCYEIKTNSYSAILDKKQVYKKSLTLTHYKNGWDPNYNIYVDMNNDGVINAIDYAIITKQLRK